MGLRRRPRSRHRQRGRHRQPRRDPETGQCSESYNYALGSAVEPGSTFKLASLMAMLETGRIAPSDTIDTGDGAYKPSRGCSKMTDTEPPPRRLRPPAPRGGVRAEFQRRHGQSRSAALRRDPQAWLDALADIGIGRKLGVNLAGEGTPTVHKAPGSAPGALAP